MNINKHKTITFGFVFELNKNSSLLGNWKLKITREACDINVKSSLKMPHVWRHAMPDEVFRAIRMYKLSFLFLLLGYHFLKMSWVFIVADWLPNPWETFLSPLAVATITLDFQQGKCLGCLLQPSASKKEQTNSFAFCPWDMTLHCLYVKRIDSKKKKIDQRYKGDESTSC